MAPEASTYTRGARFPKATSSKQNASQWKCSGLFWLWLVKDDPVDVSVIGGFHVGRVDGPADTKGFDITFLTSGHVAPKLELYGALDIARNSFDDFDDSFTTVHLVPGIEYALRPDIDLVAEVGLGLNDSSNHYVSGGIAFYIR